MTWMLTATGSVVQLDLVKPDYSVDILDIAHHLAQINRFTGACCRPYSVAEHSLLVREILRSEGYGPAVQLAGLMHDAHEAYTGDISSPFKQVLGAHFAHIEHSIADAVRRRFCLHPIFESFGAVIKAADLRARATERMALMPAGGPAWPVNTSHQTYAGWQFDNDDFMTWADWRTEFLDEFADLSEQGKDQLDRAQARHPTTHSHIKWGA